MNCIRCKKSLDKNESLHGMHELCFCEEFQVESQSKFEDLFERSSSSGPKAPKDRIKKFNSSFFHGRYRKYSGSLGQKNYIIKVQEPEFPELPSVEYLCNQIAKALSLPLPEFHLIFFENKSYAFLSRNLMDTHAPATLDHIYKFLKEDADFNCETLCALIQNETGRLADVHKFVEICLFDALLGNNDRHGRNLAFITKGGGVRHLSPLYDNPSYIGIADEIMLNTDLRPRGTIETKNSKEPSLKDYLQDFDRLGLGGASMRFQQKVFSRSSTIFELIRNSIGISENRKIALIKLIEKRMQEFKNV